MAAIQYLVPGGAYLNEGTSQVEYLIPGGAYVDETSAAVGGNNAGPLVGGNILNKALVGGGLVS